MIDIDAEFRKAMGYSTSTASATDPTDKPLTLEMLREVKRKIDAMGPPPVPVKTSRHVPALGSVKTKSQPISDDMRQMVEDIGPQKVPVAYVMETPFGNMAVTNPANLKEQSD